jgi:hypothetical protein
VRSASYDAAAAGRYLKVLLTAAAAFRELQAELPGETSPLQLWPHHFDLAVTWFSGRTVEGMENAAPEHRDESVTLGLSTGDDADPEPYLYAIAHPWPRGVETRPLATGRWHAGAWNGGYLPWCEAVAGGEPGAEALAFCRSAQAALAAAQAG